MKKEKFSSINGLRAISIIMVLIHHLEIQYQVFEKWRDVKILYPIINFLADGHMGVNVFFVLSGFLITSLLIEEEAQTATVSLKNFFIRRTLRIFPAYYFLLLFYFVLQLNRIIVIPNQSWLTAITYTKYFNWNLDWYTAHAWSLSVEEHFYLLWPLVFVYAKKIRKYVVYALFLVVPFIRIYAHYHVFPWLNDLTIFLRIDAIAIGCIFALNRNRILFVINKHWAAVFAGSLVLLFGWTNAGLLAYQHNLRLGFIFIPLGMGDGTIANISIAFLMMYSVFGPKKQWHAFLNTRLMNFIGMLSYSIYLWQQFFFAKSSYIFNKLPFNILFIFLASLFSCYLVEKPFLKIKSRLAKRSFVRHKLTQLQ